MEEGRTSWHNINSMQTYEDGLMNTECSAERKNFHGLGRRGVVVGDHGVEHPSDGGAEGLKTGEGSIRSSSTVPIAINDRSTNDGPFSTCVAPLYRSTLVRQAA
jgi:hypothetical protein